MSSPFLCPRLLLVFFCFNSYLQVSFAHLSLLPFFFIPGVRDRIGEAVQPEEIYEIFIKKLQDVLSKNVLDKAILDSFSSKKSVMKRGKRELSGFFNSTDHTESNGSKKRMKNVPDLLNDLKTEDQKTDFFSFGFSFII